MEVRRSCVHLQWPGWDSCLNSRLGRLHSKLLSPGAPVGHCPKQARKAEEINMNEVRHRMKTVATCSGSWTSSLGQ